MVPTGSTYRHEGDPIQFPPLHNDIYADMRDKILAMNKTVIAITDAFHLAIFSERRYMLEYNKPEPPVECDACGPLTPATNGAF